MKSGVGRDMPIKSHVHQEHLKSERANNEEKKGEEVDSKNEGIYIYIYIWIIVVLLSFPPPFRLS